MSSETPALFIFPSSFLCVDLGLHLCLLTSDPDIISHARKREERVSHAGVKWTGLEIGSAHVCFFQ